ncbi:MAG: hypothetical protein R3F62_14955 [Planctomycetota bacterium]
MASSTTQARALLVRQLAAQTGCTPAATKRLVDETAADEGLFARLVDAWVETGACLLGPSGPQVFLAQLERLDAPGLAVAADLRRARALTPTELFRLAQLYGVLGRTERAATAFRELWTQAGLPLEYSVRLGIASATSAPELSLAAADRVAETILTRDLEAEDDGPDLLRDAPHKAAVLLGLARDVALAAGDPDRAASLARAASALWGRLDHPPSRWTAMAQQARTLVAASQQSKARQVLTRWRDEAQEQGDAQAEAQAIASDAERVASEGKLGHAASLLAEAVELLESMGDPAGALTFRERQGQLLALEGSWDSAARTFASARALAEEASSPDQAASLWVSEGECALRQGKLSHALRCGENGRQDASSETLERSTLLVAAVLVAAGDGSRALKALVRLTDSEDPRTLARSLELRAELCLGRGDEAGAQLAYADAARAYAGEPRRAAECVVARAELALLQGDRERCRALCERADKVDAPHLDLRHELLQALLGEPDEAELLLEDAVERTAEEGHRLDHLRALHANLGFALTHDRDPDALLERLGASLAQLRETLPEKLRARFGTSPWVGRLRAFASHPEAGAAIKALVERLGRKG